MTIVCNAVINENHNIELDESIKRRLRPGTIIRISIEEYQDIKEEKRKVAVEYIKHAMEEGSLELLEKDITREDAHDRDE